MVSVTFLKVCYLSMYVCMMDILLSHHLPLFDFPDRVVRPVLLVLSGHLAPRVTVNGPFYISVRDNFAKNNECTCVY